MHHYLSGIAWNLPFASLLSLWSWSWLAKGLCSRFCTKPCERVWLLSPFMTYQNPFKHILILAPGNSIAAHVETLTCWLLHDNQLTLHREVAHKFRDILKPLVVLWNWQYENRSQARHFFSKQNRWMIKQTNVIVCRICSCQRLD